MELWPIVLGGAALVAGIYFFGCWVGWRLCERQWERDLHAGRIEIGVRQAGRKE